jgi:hypothetical protein
MANNIYIEVAAPAAYAAASSPDVAATFIPDYWVLTYISGGDTYFSFDGVNNHGRVRATFTAPLVLRSKGVKLWVKQVAGAASVGIGAATDV